MTKSYISHVDLTEEATPSLHDNARTFRRETREFNEGRYTYTIWLDWSGDKCRIGKVDCITGSGGGTMAAEVRAGERTAAELGWDHHEFETAEDAERFVRDKHRAAKA